MQFSDQQVQYLKSYISQLKPSLLSYIVCYLDKRNKIALDNINKVFGNVLSIVERTKLRHSFYSHRIKFIKEIAIYPFLTKKRLLARTKLKGKEHIEQLIKENKPVIIITGHIGNCEMALCTLTMHIPELLNKLAAVRKIIKPQWLCNMLFRRTRMGGFTIIPSIGTVTNIVDCLQKNKHVYFSIDNLPRNKNIIVDFFGYKMRGHRSIALLSKKTRVSVIPSRTYRDKEGIHVIEFFPAVPWITCDTLKNEISKNSQQYYHSLEQFILEYPEQWIWDYRRWF